MRAFFGVLVVAILGSVVNFVSSTIEYDSLHGIGAFKKNGGNFTNLISDSIEIYKNFAGEAVDPIKKANLAMKGTNALEYIFKSKAGKKFAMKALAWGGKSLKFATKLIPFASEALDLVQGLAEMFEEESDWKKEFEEKILGKVREEIYKNEVGNIGTFLTTVQENIPFINQTIFCIRSKYEKKNPDKQPDHVPSQFLNQRVIAKCNADGVKEITGPIHYDFQKIANAFTNGNSSYEHYALLGAPVLIELGLIASLFEPMAMDLISGVAKNIKISCKYRDAMIDHIPFVLEARFAKTNAGLTNAVRVRNEPYNPSGYDPAKSLPCEVCTSDDCLTDQFGTEKFNKGNDCEIGYLKYLRHLVEKLFPIGMLDKTCKRPLGKPTGFGWATIKLKNFKGSRLSESKDEYGTYTCEYFHAFGNKCDPYVKVYVGGERVLITDTAQGKEDYNVDRIYYTSNPIQKSTEIEINVREDDSSDGGEDRSEQNSQPMLRTSGTVESFMSEPIRCADRVYQPTKQGGHYLPDNCLQVDIIWQDKRE